MHHHNKRISCAFPLWASKPSPDFFSVCVWSCSGPWWPRECLPVEQTLPPSPGARHLPSEAISPRGLSVPLNFGAGPGTERGGCETPKSLAHSMPIHHTRPGAGEERTAPALITAKSRSSPCAQGSVPKQRWHLLRAVRKSRRVQPRTGAKHPHAPSPIRPSTPRRRTAFPRVFRVPRVRSPLHPGKGSPGVPPAATRTMGGVWGENHTSRRTRDRSFRVRGRESP